MINVFDYSDFRKYLADYYADKKRDNPRFSYQIIANKAGIRNKGFIYNIIRGKKALLKSNIYKISHALGHTRYEAEYFETLISFSQTRDAAGRRYLFEKMSSMKNMGKTRSAAQILRKDQYEFYSNWYHVMVRLLIGMYEFKGDCKWLAKMIDPPITVTQAKHSVQLLDKLGLIKKDADGVYRISDLNLTTGKDVENIAFQNFHQACNNLASRAFTHFPPNVRNMTGLSLGISEEGYKRICEEIQEFQKKVIEITNTDRKANRAYQLNFHFFPTSKSAPERKLP
jgi:uncharacterized protein (TIGR02147 family)